MEKAVFHPGGRGWKQKVSLGVRLAHNESKWFAKVTHVKNNQVYEHPGSLASDFWTCLASGMWLIGNPHQMLGS